VDLFSKPRIDHRNTSSELLLVDSNDAGLYVKKTRVSLRNRSSSGSLASDRGENPRLSWC